MSFVQVRNLIVHQRTFLRTPGYIICKFAAAHLIFVHPDGLSHMDKISILNCKGPSKIKQIHSNVEYLRSLLTYVHFPQKRFSLYVCSVIFTNNIKHK